ncbi:MAG: TonB-dependent receptor [Saprospirales bacterium]|nr:MAG: TonB-dependent receptor [Saprospirales bacterium]
MVKNHTKIISEIIFRALFSVFFIISLVSCINAQSGIIKGKVFDASNRELIPFANVFLTSEEAGTTTDIYGEFLLKNIPPGTHELRISFVGYRTKILSEIEVPANRPLELEIELEPSRTDLEEVVVRASPFRRTEESPLSLRNIGVAEIKRNPGGNRDISRVIQSLPGVTAPSTFRNDLIIRGGAPNENRFYLDDIEVPNINHFATQGATGGPASIINIDFVREVDFYSGAFPANRGNALSSVFGFRLVNGRSDRIGGRMTVGASDIGASLEGPISDNTTFIASARRSYLQFLFSALGLPFLPTYNDFQVKITHRFASGDELYFSGIGAIDNFELNLDADDSEETRFLLENLPVNEQWTYTNGLVYRHFRDNGSMIFVLSRNMLNNEATKYRDNQTENEEELILKYRSQEIENKFRFEHAFRENSYRVLYGAGVEYIRYNNNTFNRIFTSAGPETVDFSSEIDFVKYFAFGQLSREFMDGRLVASIGVRADGNSFSRKFSNPMEHFSPRVSASYFVLPELSVNFTAGIYYQLPPYTVLGFSENGELVNKNNAITFVRADHLTLGLEYLTGERSRVTIEGYFKRYDNYPLLLRDRVSLANFGGDFGVVGNEPASPDTRGRTYGLEVLFQQRLQRGFYGIAAYTLGVSEFTSPSAGDGFFPSAWDSRHIISLTAGKQLGNNWEVGVKWRFQSGLPRTPFSKDSNLTFNWDRRGRGLPDFSRINSLRGDFINGLDIRIDKQWFYEKWSLNLFLDIQNVLASSLSNPELILDRPLDQNGRPIGSGTIINPNDPAGEQRYLLKEIDTGSGTVLPTIGIVIGF